MKRVALYLRVSTDDQTCENQRRELEAAARRHGWEIAAIFQDEGISGAKGRDGRPGFDRVLKSAARREFDGIAAWSVDRLGRSLQDLIAFLAELHAKGIGLYLHQQGLDTTTPAGKAMFQMMGVFAEFERAMIVERVRAGIARKRAERGGRWGRGQIDAALAVAIREELARGTGINKTARLCGVGGGTVQRIKREMIEARP
jgi:DNA invertase Pin-like site-specific DNA recombinase